MSSTYKAGSDDAPKLQELAARKRQQNGTWQPNHCALAREAYPGSGVDRSVPCADSMTEARK